MYTQRWHVSPLLGALGAAAIALSGCGKSGAAATGSATPAAKATQTTTSPADTAATSQTASSGPKIDLQVTSAVGETLPARYTCDGADISPPLRWGPVPRDTVEIALFMIRFNRRAGTESPAWGIAGLKPTTHFIAAGRLPAGTIVGRNEFGQDQYSVCPAPGTTAEYVVALDPLPRKLPLRRGFNVESALLQAVHAASEEGELAFHYRRS
jgi:phosphatidylethanolamine-binding protein (PEBP) family uncharacterized protein